MARQLNYHIWGWAVKNPKPPDDDATGNPTGRSAFRRYNAQNGGPPVQPGSSPGTPTSSHWLQGTADTLLQQALNALIVGDAATAADAARVALTRADGPNRDVYTGWSTWMLGLAHLYANDQTGAGPFLQRAQELAFQTQQPTLAMAVYLAQQLASSYDQQMQMRQHANHLLKQLEDQETHVTQQFRAMLKFARDSWPSLQAGGPQTTEIVAAPEVGLNPLPALYVQMLGTFRVAAGGHEISLRQSRKAADIFKLMLAHRERPASKDMLVQTLWPDVESRTATHRLHLAISSLRQMLGNVVGTEGPGYIIFRDEAYFLNPLASIDTDVERFLDAFQQGQKLEQENQADEAIAPYETAIALYRDNYLIENLYDDWTGPARNHLHETYLRTLGRLCGLYWQAGRYQECLDTARKMLASDATREDGHRFVMGSLNALGYRNQALRQFQICEEVLGADLGVQPTAATVELYNHIKNAK